MYNKNVFPDMFQISLKGWNILSNAPEARNGARSLLIHLAEALDVPVIGINFINEETAYSWIERVDRIGQSVPDSVENKSLKIPFPSGSSFWFLEGFHGESVKLKPLLNLLADQWLRLKETSETRISGIRKPVKRNIDNPAWIAVSYGAGVIRSKLQELSFSKKPLLLSGEVGCGKKYLAELIHRSGPYPSAPFCGPDSPELNGTLFIPDWRQIDETECRKLLNDPRRLIAAVIPGNEVDEIHRSWNKCCGAQGSLIKIPPLREHTEDIPLLAGHFLEQGLLNTGFPVPSISTAALEALMAYKWPGNIRELKEVMFRSALDFNGRRITLANLPPAVRGSINLPGGSFPQQLAALEYEVLREELSRQKGNITRSAEVLGLSPRQLSCRVKKYGIDVRKLKRQGKLYSYEIPKEDPPL